MLHCQKTWYVVMWYVSWCGCIASLAAHSLACYATLGKKHCETTNIIHVAAKEVGHEVGMCYDSIWKGLGHANKLPKRECDWNARIG